MASKWKSPASRVVLSRTGLAVVASLVILASLFGLVAARALSGPEQPIPFPHVSMVGQGVQCLFCHSDAMRSPAAGIPSVERCMGCHRVIATNAAAIQTLAGYSQRGDTIPWVRVYVLPRFVYFSHEVHLASGINCERCHGDVGRMKVTVRAVHMNMGWCLDCHEKQPNADQLRDCQVCHQ